MAIDQRKRQMQLHRKAAKRRQALLAKRAAVGNVANLPKSQQIEIACKAPILECLVPEQLFEIGKGTVIVSRKLVGTRVAFAAFLLDTQCLGVKDAFFRVTNLWEYRETVAQMESSGGPYRPQTAAYACKLVEDCVRYASSLGFSPHPDYRAARKILDEIDSSQCAEVFAFGQKGKPFYVNGPHESREDIKRILAILRSTVGEGNYDYMIVQ